MNPTSPFVIYGLLISIGLLGAVADSLIFKAATGSTPVKPLATGTGIWLFTIAMVYLYFRLDRHGFTVALLMMIVIHAVAAAIIDGVYFSGTIGKREVLGFLLAIAAVVVLEGGAERQPPVETVVE